MRLGLVTTGQGPREEYERFHRGALRAMGIDAEIVVRHGLDGLSGIEIDALAPDDSEPAVHCNVRAGREDASLLGSGWRDVWMSRRAYLERTQACLTALESEERVDASIVCIAEEIPVAALKSRMPVVLPWLAMTSYASVLAATSDEVRVGLFVYGDRQRRQQEETWAGLPFADQIALQFEPLGDDPVAAARRMAEYKPNVSFMWGYGIGLGGGDSPDLIQRVERELDAPVVVPHIAAVMALRQLVVPSIDARRFLDGNGEAA